MSWRIKVEHRSRYTYAGAVFSSYNEARITPLTTTAQLVLDAPGRTGTSTTGARSCTRSTSSCRTPR